MHRDEEMNLEPLCHDRFKEVVGELEPADRRYYIAGARWKYISRALRYFDEINSAGDVGSVLEIGARNFPIVLGSDVMDLAANVNEKYAGEIFSTDATDIPWKFQDDQYDVLIALQTWEHLEKKQIECFQEARRISRKAIMSFPHLWRSKCPMHNMITREKILEWTSGLEPIQEIKIGVRLVCLFDFEQ